MARRVERRLLLQYLEPSEAAEAADPSHLAARLQEALAVLPVTDLALGWRLSPALIAALRPAIPDDITLWRWVPMFVDSGSGMPSDEHLAVGPDGQAPIPFHDLSDFRFLCLDRDDVAEQSLRRAISLVGEIGAAGVLLDRIRWPSPSRRPAVDLCCFCYRSREIAVGDGLDPKAVVVELRSAAESLQGRRSVVGALLGRENEGALSEFLRWRSGRVTEVVRRVVSGLHEAGVRSSLDVFTPALGCSVGQDLKALAGLGEWSKSMTYLDALGPASMPWELRGYADWLGEAGEPDPARFLSDLLGFAAPGLLGGGEQLDALRTEGSRLTAAVGTARAIVGIDAVEIPGVCDIPDAVLQARLREIGEVGFAPSWDLLAIGPARLRLIAETIQTQGREPRG